MTAIEDLDGTDVFQKDVCSGVSPLVFLRQRTDLYEEDKSRRAAGFKADRSC